jgi:Uma2 family endonuclease
MPSGTCILTLAEYHAQYAGENGWEFWFGEAVRKPVPTWLHSILQTPLCELIYKAGYFSGSELELRIDPNWEPRPDVAGALKLEQPYPTRPVEIVIEILSDDQMEQLLKKCGHYARIGILQIFVADPESRRIWQWRGGELLRVTDICLGNGVVITGALVWSEFDRRIAAKPDSYSPLA